MRVFRLVFQGLLIGSLMLSACVRTPQPGDTKSLAGLKRMGAVSAGNRIRGRGAKSPTRIRSMALQETALSLGAQAGLAAQARRIDHVLQSHNRNLEQAFNFQPLLLHHNVLPPILGRGDNTLKLDNPTVIRISDRTYKIEQQAQFVTTAPNWREYLIMDFEQPPLPDRTMLPCTVSELEVWNKYVTQGWKNGRKQANAIFSDNIARLEHDYKGILIYRKLLAQGMVTPPFVAKTDLGVTGDRDNLRINDKVLRIAVLPSMQVDSSKWKAAVTAREIHQQQLLGEIMDEIPGKEGSGKPIVISQSSFDDGEF